MKKTRKYLLIAIGILLSVVVFVPGNDVYAKSKGVKVESLKDKWIINEVEKYDKNENGYLSEKELKKITKLDLESDSGPINLKKIGKLKYLKKLTINNCCPKRIKNVKAIYKLTNLESLNLVSCNLKKGTELNLKSLKKLKELSLSVSRLKSLDISKNKKLEYLDMSSNIEKLNLTKNKNLKTLYICGNDNLKTINLKKNKKLEKLTLVSIKSKYSLKYNEKLKKLYIDNAEVPDISKNKKLRVLNCFYPLDNEISIGAGNEKLKEIDICLNENIPLKFSVDGCKKLNDLHLWGFGTFTEIKVTNCGEVKKFNLAHCKIENLECDIVQNVSMFTVEITGEELAESKVNVVK